MSCTTGDRYDIYAAQFSERGRWMRMRCIKGTERYDRGGGYSPFSVPKSDAGVKIRLLREF